MTFEEAPVLLECSGAQICAILTSPVAPLDVGVVVVVGGPQYRVGSHRQFVLLARALARKGISSLRFDYRGMGDSDGERRSFEAIDSDIRVAAEGLLARMPAVRKLVLWGLCDGASAALIATSQMPQLAGVVALNPWMRTEATLDRTLVRHYYSQRLFEPEFWSKLLSGRLALRGSIREFLRRAASQHSSSASFGMNSDAEPFQQRMLAGLLRFSGRVLVVISARDLTAREFLTYCNLDPAWREALADRQRVEMRHLSEADHTFSSDTSRAEAEELTIDFVLRCRDVPEEA